MEIKLNPQTAADWGTFIAGIIAFLTAGWAAMTYPFKTFLTIKAADAKFVKKVEADGTRAYVHPQEWTEMKERFDKSIETNEKWQGIAKDWIEKG